MCIALYLFNIDHLVDVYIVDRIIIIIIIIIMITIINCINKYIT